MYVYEIIVILGVQLEIKKICKSTNMYLFFSEKRETSLIKQTKQNRILPEKMCFLMV